MVYDEAEHTAWLKALRHEAVTSLSPMLPTPSARHVQAFGELHNSIMLGWEDGRLDDIFAEALRHGLRLNHGEAMHLLILSSDNLLPADPNHFNWAPIKAYILGVRPDAAHRPPPRHPFSKRDVPVAGSYRSSSDL